MNSVELAENSDIISVLKLPAMEQALPNYCPKAEKILSAIFLLIDKVMKHCTRNKNQEKKKECFYLQFPSKYVTISQYNMEKRSFGGFRAKIFFCL